MPIMLEWKTPETAGGPCVVCAGGIDILTAMFVNKVTYDQTHLRLCRGCALDFTLMLVQMVAPDLPKKLKEALCP